MPFMLLFEFTDLPAQLLAALRTTTRLEWVAVGTGFACVGLAARESFWNFPVAIVSCGARNVYNYPHVELMDRLAARQIPTFRTDKQGAIMVETDGVSLHVTPTIR